MHALRNMLSSVLLATTLGLTACVTTTRGNTPAAVYGAPGIEIAAGTRVAAIWTNGAYYPGTVQAVLVDGYAIAYDDGDRWIAPRDRVLPMATAPVAVGDHVLAVWKNGKMYPGRVTAVTPGGATIAWDDGDTPMFVPEKNIAQINVGGASVKGTPQAYRPELIAPGSGWFCWSRPHKDGQPFSNCSRTLESCEAMQAKEAQSYQGVSTCASFPKAWCHIWGPSAQPVCVPTEGECTHEVEQFLKGGTPTSVCKEEP